MKNRNYPFYQNRKIKSLRDLVDYRSRETPDKTAFSFMNGNIMEKRSYAEFRQDIECLSCYLRKNHISGHIALIGENSYSWLLFYFSIIMSGNVVVPLDKELNADEIGKLIRRSDCSAFVFSAAFEKDANHLCDDGLGVPCFNMNRMSDFLSEGGVQTGESGASGGKEPDPDRLACIIYTSGTTGDSKGVMLSENNLICDMNYSCSIYQIEGPAVAVLPFHHSFGLMTGALICMNYGVEVLLNSRIKKLQEEIKQIKPRTLFFVPAYVQTFNKRILDGIQKSGKMPLHRRLVRFTNALSKVGINLKPLLLKKQTAVFGGKLKYIICGGAPLEPSLIQSFRDLGINLSNGYGITECSPVVSVNRNHYYRDGSVGQLVHGCEVRISDGGEVLVRGGNVMLGYYKDEAATEEVLIDGWFNTGDLGYLDQDGFLFLTGRTKNLIILENGKNVSPEELEEKLQAVPLVKDVVVYSADGVVTAEIFPDSNYAESQGIKQIYGEIKKCVTEINSGLPVYKRILSIKIATEEFDKTTTNKIKRQAFLGGKSK